MGIGKIVTQFGTWSAHPAALAVVAGYAVLWLIFEPVTLEWHGAATLATWTMTLFIQRAEHRDTQAIHAKLDELLKAQGGAEGSIATIDEQEPETIERHRDAKRSEL